MTIPGSDASASPTTVDSITSIGTTAFESSSSCGGGGGGGGGLSCSSGSRATPLDWRRRRTRGRGRTVPVGTEEEDEERAATTLLLSNKLDEGSGMSIAINGVENHGVEQQHPEGRGGDGDGGGDGDEELEELVRRNENTLGEIRRDLGLLASERRFEGTNDDGYDDNSSTSASTGTSLNRRQQQQANPSRKATTTTLVSQTKEIALTKKPDYPWKTSPIISAGGTEPHQSGPANKIGQRPRQRSDNGEGSPRTSAAETRRVVPATSPSQDCEVGDKAPSSEPLSVSDLLLQLRNDSNSGGGGGCVAGRSARNKVVGEESQKDLDLVVEKDQGGGGGGEGKDVAGGGGDGGRITLVAANARAMLMS